MSDQLQDQHPDHLPDDTVQSTEGPGPEMPSRRKATIANLVFQYSSVLLGICQGILLVPLYVAKIDFRLYGAWLASGGIVAWCTVMEGGLTLVVRQRVAHAYGKQDFDQLGAVIGTGTLLTVGTGLFPPLIGLSIAWLIPGWLGIEGENARLLSMSFLLACTSAGLVIIAGAPAACQQGLQRNVAHTVIYLSAGILGVVVTVMLLLSGFGLPSIPLGLVVRFGLESVVRYPYVLLAMRRRWGIRLKFNWGEVRAVFHLIYWSFLTNMTQQITRRIDLLLLAIYVDVKMVPLVALTGRAWEVVQMLSERVGVAFMPSLAHLHGEDDQNRFGQISLKMIRYVAFALILMVATTLAMNRNFIALWVPMRNVYAGHGFNQLMGMAVIIGTLALVIRQPLIAVGRIRMVSIVDIIQNLFRVGVLVLLLPLIGHIAVPASLLLACLAVGAWYLPSALLKVLGTSRGEILNHLSRGARLLLVAGGVTIVWAYAPQPQTWPVFTAYFVGCLVSLLVVMGLTDKGGRQVTCHVLAKTARRFGLMVSED